MKLLSLDKISYEYDANSKEKHDALRQVTLNINSGEFVGLIGHTGSGKSTLVQQMNGLLKPSSGVIKFHDEDIWGEKFSRKKLRQKVALVFQYPDHQLFEETILKDVMFGPLNQGYGEEISKEKASQALKLVGISEELFLTSPFDLSGGQKRRVAIAGALAMEPEILVLDEPTAGLDPAGRNEILSNIKSLQKKLGLSVILVSHSMEDVGEYADRIIVINAGKILFDDKANEVYRNYEKLEEVGLKAPETVYILKELKEKGIDVNIDKTKINDCVEEIIRVLKNND